MNQQPWQSIFDKYKIHKHNFKSSPFILSANEIKEVTSRFTSTSMREPRILYKHDNRGKRPLILIENDLFILPIKNGIYALIKGEGYVDIPEISNEVVYSSKLDFELVNSKIGDSEMQHLDFAYASSLIRSFF